MNEDDDLNAAFVCTIVQFCATILLNLYAELSELCTKRKRRVWVNLRRRPLSSAKTRKQR